ncbi:E3 ubiquitin-protein ligase TRIM7-like [Rana temporaria]|uniref:E3 ubiquitin-protein ligase TRIM7-like n=1 Tax=Rana temporaria TaxID=8407 RepID=UPI001AADD7A8|nr:E3 ubiquitin-protein ligase TRIM7-like [Rana temporaria]
MASADLRAELECSICLNIYTDPVILRCGHNFCQVCIDRVLNTKKGNGDYSCPECREKFQDRPALQRNMKLRNIVENFLSTQPDPEESTEVFCTYCIHAAVPAVKSCLHCEASLCNNHLRVHSKSPEHILSDPTTSLQNRKCPIHKEVFKYYCTEDFSCVCVSCCLIGEHKGHSKVSLDEASNAEKNKLRNAIPMLLTKRDETEKRIKSLLKCRRDVEKKAAVDTEKFTALFRELRRQLEDLEKRVLTVISKKAERVSCSVNDLIQQLEIKKDELSKKMCHIEELCNTTDPLTVLQESDTAVNQGIYIKEPAEIFLDADTAHSRLQISDDRKTASGSPKQNIPETPARFRDHAQVMSSRSFSTGQHYWEVDVGRSYGWRVGMCYPSIDRREQKSKIGYNKKSWGLERDNDQYSVIHDSNKIGLPDNISSKRVRIYLDYEAGQISFYSLSHPILHLYTFAAAFTEPLHAVLGMWDRGFCIVNPRSGRIRVM